MAAHRAERNHYGWLVSRRTAPVTVPTPERMIAVEPSIVSRLWRLIAVRLAARESQLQALALLDLKRRLAKLLLALGEAVRALCRLGFSASPSWRIWLSGLLARLRTPAVSLAPQLFKSRSSLDPVHKACPVLAAPDGVEQLVVLRLQVGYLDLQAVF
ncbi:MAG: hypothetical protein ACREOM_11795 [Candidatus Dormibacteraceae bacterium]